MLLRKGWGSGVGYVGKDVFGLWLLWRCGGCGCRGLELGEGRGGLKDFSNWDLGLWSWLMRETGEGVFNFRGGWIEGELQSLPYFLVDCAL